MEHTSKKHPHTIIRNNQSTGTSINQINMTAINRRTQQHAQVRQVQGHAYDSAVKSINSVLKILKPLAGCGIVKDKYNNNNNDRVRRYDNDSDDGDDDYADACTSSCSTHRNNKTTDAADAAVDAYTIACSMDRKLCNNDGCKCREKARCRCIARAA